MATNKKGTTGKDTLAVLAAQLAAGAQKHFPAGSSLSVGGALLTLVQIATTLNGFAALRTDVDTARAALDTKIALETAQATAMRAFMSAFERIVRGSFGNQPDVMADFGLAPDKPRAPLTVVQKAAAAAKRKATRAARGTVGSTVKAAIKGNVTGVVVTPVTTEPPAAATGTTSGTNAPANAQAPGAPAAPLLKS